MTHICYLWMSSFSSKIKIRSSHSNFPEQILTTTEVHFITEHISFSPFWCSLKLLVGSKRKRLSRHLLLVMLYLRQPYMSTYLCFQLQYKNLDAHEGWAEKTAPLSIFWLIKNTMLILNDCQGLVSKEDTQRCSTKAAVPYLLQRSGNLRQRKILVPFDLVQKLLHWSYWNIGTIIWHYRPLFLQ